MTYSSEIKKWTVIMDIWHEVVYTYLHILGCTVAKKFPTAVIDAFPQVL